MGSKSEELEELSRELERLESDLAAAQARMRALDPIEGKDDDAKTTVDRPSSIPPPPPRPPRSLAPSSGQLKAAVVGAGFMLGLVLVVLLIVNISLTRRVEPTASAAAPIVSAMPPAATVSVAPPPAQVTAVSPHDEIPPPPPPSAVATASAPEPSAPPAPATHQPAPVAAVSTAPGSLTVVCSPRCESITDNNVLIGSNNLSNVPVAPGPHKLVLTAGSAKKTVNVNIASGQLREVRVVMDSSSHDYGF